MRVHVGRLLAVLEPDQSKPTRLGPSSPAAASRTIGRPGGIAQPDREGSNKRAEATANLSAFDLLHTARGFSAFEQWYKRTLSASTVTQTSSTPRPELGILWSQCFCFPNALHEQAFLELLRVFAECSDSEAYDFFDILDSHFLGMLGLQQVYLAMCLVAAIGCSQVTKFLYFHSSWIFTTLAAGSIEAPAEQVSWPRILTLLRLLGAPCAVVTKVCAENGIHGPLADLDYETFMAVLFPIAVQLDRGVRSQQGALVQNSAAGIDRSRLCVVL
mmetsp:Transcript_28656/g.66063  ORF Transcript_28656/g.66063 Transcript_28656/m.66063 type:complete len:273 (+) Transcript_28656:53-871(+)